MAMIIEVRARARDRHPLRPEEAAGLIALGFIFALVALLAIMVLIGIAIAPSV